MPTDLVVSHYRVLEAIGHGGMGEVYLGIDETLRRKVALKSILPEHRLQPAIKARFLREARTLSLLDHPNICRVHDYIETDDRDWIVLELVEGRTLADALALGGKGLDRLSIARQIAAVLVVTHSAGVVHRDLKPGNVMVTPMGQVKVLDFGLSATVAGAAPASSSHEPHADAPLNALEETRLPPGAGAPVAASFASVAGGIKGTAAYMSPEQARGEIVTSASDMYSFGLLMQELFTGQRPYSPDLTMHELIEQRGRGISLDPQGLSTAMAALVGRLKSLAPTQRPTAVETADRLRWIADAPARLRRNLIAAAVIGAALLGAAKYTIDLTRERNAAIAARDEADQRRGQAETLIGFMVGDLRDKLTPIGRLEILDDVSKQALAYFASLPADRLTDEELYQRSQALHQLGQIRQARADVPGALAAYEESLAQAQAVAERRPDNAKWQLGLGTSHFYAGDVKMRRGDLAAALAHFEAYKEIAERLVASDPNDVTFRLEQSYGHSNIAAIYQRQGNLRGAREQLERTVAIQEQLAKEKPADAQLAASRANSLNRLAIVEDALGAYTTAAATFARELSLYRVLLERDPRNATIRRRLAVGLNFRSATLRALGRPREAIQHLEDAARESEALVALDGANANWQRDLGVTLAALGRLETEQQQPGASATRLRRAIDILAPLADRTPIRPEARRDLARAQSALADALNAQGQSKAAVAAAQAAVAALEPLVQKDATNVDLLRDVLIAQTAQAAVTPGADQTRLFRTIAQFEPVAQRTTDRVPLEAFVRALLAAGRPADAGPFYEKLFSMGYREPTLVALWQRLSSSAVR